jgi:hypothetical protein
MHGDFNDDLRRLARKIHGALAGVAQAAELA